MGESRGLISAIAEQIAPVIAGVALNDGFGLFIVAARTQLSASIVHILLREKFEGELECLELNQHRSEESSPANEMGRLLSGPSSSSPTVVRFLGGRESADIWVPLFRRMNENRNAIIRDFAGTLILVLAEDQIVTLASEAPDLWSVAMVTVVGWRSPPDLWLEMANHYSVLDALTLQPRAEVISATGVLAYPELLNLLDIDDRERRARIAFEMLEGRSSTESKVRSSLPASPGNVVTFDADRKQPLLDIRTGFQHYLWEIAVDSDFANIVDLGGHPRSTVPRGVDVAFVWPESPPTALARLIQRRQVLADIDMPICVVAVEMMVGTIGEFIRRHFHLVFELAVTKRPIKCWRVEAGTRTLAPRILCPSGVRVTVEGEIARFEFFRGPVELGYPEQLWLPGIRASDLGAAQLYERPWTRAHSTGT